MTHSLAADSDETPLALPRLLTPERRLRAVGPAAAPIAQPTPERAPGGPTMGELTAMARRRADQAGIVVERSAVPAAPPVGAAAPAKRLVNRQNLIEGIGMALAETEQRMEARLAEAEGRLAARVEALERQG